MNDVLDDQMLMRYRSLLDAEDQAFDDLEHACEDGDRATFDAEMQAWRTALGRKLAYLSHIGVAIPVPDKAS